MTAGYFSLKQAAQRLGVHEQTLRSWEKRGLIRLARLPGSGYRRVPVAEVERLLREMNERPAVSGVHLEPPSTDRHALEQAAKLAAQVRVTLAPLETEATLDDFMAQRRGRTWMP